MPQLGFIPLLSAKLPGSSRDLSSSFVDVEDLDVSSTGGAEGLAKVEHIVGFLFDYLLNH